jgi:hypothetical protein
MVCNQMRICERMLALKNLRASPLIVTSRIVVRPTFPTVLKCHKYQNEASRHCRVGRPIKRVAIADTIKKNESRRPFFLREERPKVY